MSTTRYKTMALDTAKNLLQPSRKHAFVTFNNQDSVLLSMSIPEQERLCILHDNRIFAFKNQRDLGKNSDAAQRQMNVKIESLMAAQDEMKQQIKILMAAASTSNYEREGHNSDCDSTSNERKGHNSNGESTSNLRKGHNSNFISTSNEQEDNCPIGNSATNEREGHNSNFNSTSNVRKGHNSNFISTSNEQEDNSPIGNSATNEREGHNSNVVSTSNAQEGSNSNGNSTSNAQEGSNSNGNSTSNEQNVLLNLLTTPKYRALSGMYMIFRLLDNMFFFCIIILSLYNRTFTMPTSADFALFATIGIELFYDVMMLTNKYWILERLSIYIGVVLYVFYFGFVCWKNANGEYTNDEYDKTVNHTLQVITYDVVIDDAVSVNGANKFVLVLVFLGIRLGAFILEECVDIAIDGELHNDLLKLSKLYLRQDTSNNGDNFVIPDVERGKKSSQDKNTGCWDSFKKYMKIDEVIMPKDVQYQGSFFAWSPKSIYTENVYSLKPFPRWLFFSLCFLPFILSFGIFLGLFILCLIASLISIFLFYILFLVRRYFCCCCCKADDSNPVAGDSNRVAGDSNRVAGDSNRVADNSKCHRCCIWKEKLMSTRFFEDLKYFWKELAHF